MHVADATSCETIEVWRQPAAIAVRAHPVLAQGVNRDDEDVGASQRSRARKIAARRPAAGRDDDQGDDAVAMRDADRRLPIANCGLRIGEPGLWIADPQCAIHDLQRAIRDPQCLYPENPIHLPLAPTPNQSASDTSATSL